jgi:hypothetical protein
MPGDVFKDIPLPRVNRRYVRRRLEQVAILLTPTCDFALKAEHAERQVAPVEVLAHDDHRIADQESPLHVFPVPPLEGLLPHGGLVQFRRAAPVHRDTLEQAERAATLDAAGVRSLLAAHTTYYTRGRTDPAHVPISPDDPRLLWEAIDASNVPSMTYRRDSLDEAVQLATLALARHHGVAASATRALVLLEEFVKHNILALSSHDVVRILSEAQALLLESYLQSPAELRYRRADLDHLAVRLEQLAEVLQERYPQQLSPGVLRDAGLPNLLPRGT